MSLPEKIICDVCGKEVRLPGGYCLTTTQIVSSPGQWRQYYKMHEIEAASLEIFSYEDFCRTQPQRRTIFLVASNPSPWMVCEICIDLFDVDKEVARDYVKKWWETEGKFLLPSGPAPFSAIDMGDGRSWG